MQPLWTCPRCGRRFANRNQTHTCGTAKLEDHFEGRDPQVVATYRRLVAVARRSGRLTVVPEKTRIALQVRMSFAALTLRRHWVDGHVVLARRRESERFRRVDVYSPRNQVHVFRLHSPDEVDAEVESWLAEAYQVGAQLHLARRNAGPG